MGDKEDRFAYLIEFCKPTASQEDKLMGCPWAGGSAFVVESNLDMSSSPEMTPCEPTRIQIVTPPDSADDVADKNSPQEEEPLFHTPPEEHNSYDSSSQGTRNCDIGDEFGDCKSLGIVEGEVNDEMFAFEEEELSGGTIPIDETEMIADDVDGSENILHYVDFVGAESGEETDAVNLDGVATEKVLEGCFVGDGQADQKGKKREAEVVDETLIEPDAGNENDGLKENGHLSHLEANDCDHLNQSVVSCKMLRSRNVVGNECGENSRGKVCEDEEFTDITNSDDGFKEMCENGGRKRVDKNAADVENLICRGDEVSKGTKRRDCVAHDGAVQKRELPLSIKGIDKDAECGRDAKVDPVGITVGLLKDFLNAFNVAVGDVNGFVQMDFLEIAKRRGLTFPRPRWWPPEGDDD